MCGRLFGPLFIIAKGYSPPFYHTKWPGLSRAGIYAGEGKQSGVKLGNPNSAGRVRDSDCQQVRIFVRSDRTSISLVSVAFSMESWAC